MSKPLQKKLHISSYSSVVGARVERSASRSLFIRVRRTLGIVRFRFLARFIVPIHKAVGR